MLHDLMVRPDSCLPIFSAPPRTSHPLLFVVEGVLDVRFLQILSRRLRTDLPAVPDLAALSAAGRIVFIPAGGGDLSAWATRLAPLGCCEVHLYDREQHPETAVRQQVISRINQRSGCRAAMTSKRALENYLHPQAIQAATGLRPQVDDHGCVAESLVCSRPQVAEARPTLSRRTRQRLMNRAKRVLNTQAVQHMTADLLAERDPAGEVLGWLRTIAAFLNS